MNNNQKATKRALLTSVMALVMCVVMLVGTTFAWFTDTASTGVNKIVAGNLKVDIVNEAGTASIENSGLKFVSADNVTKGEAILWEPNCTYLTEGFQIKNGGNLALKWKVEINKDRVTNSVVGSEATPSKSLLDVIDFSIVDASGNTVDIDNFTGHIRPAVDSDANTGLSGVYKIKAHMDANAGNDYQNLMLDGITITVYATQDTYEYDSTRNDYDKFAEYPEVTTVQIAAGEKTAVNEAVKNAITTAKAVDPATGKTTPTQIVLPANTTVTLKNGVATPAQEQTSDIKITGDKTTKIEFQNSDGGSDGSGTTYQDRANLTFQGVTISGGTEQFVARGGVVTFIDCTINGEIKKTTADKFVFSGCTFTQPVSQVGYGCKDVVFDDCEFNTDGYGIKIYSEGSTPVNLTVKNCAFKNTNNAAKSAIFLDHIIDGLTYNITVESCIFDGFTAEPTADNKWGNREIITSSFIKSGEQYVFAYQTGNTEQYRHTLDASHLVVTVE